MPIIPISLPKAPKIKPQWRPCSVIFRWNNQMIDAVEGQSYGRLVVLPSLPNDGEPHVTVTHKPSKIAILRLDSVEDAVTGTELLWDLCQSAFDRPDQSVNETLISPKIKEWIKACNRGRKLLPCPT